MTCWHRLQAPGDASFHRDREVPAHDVFVVFGASQANPVELWSGSVAYRGRQHPHFNGSMRLSRPAQFHGVQHLVNRAPYLKGRFCSVRETASFRPRSHVAPAGPRPCAWPHGAMSPPVRRGRPVGGGLRPGSSLDWIGQGLQCGLLAAPVACCRCFTPLVRTGRDLERRRRCDCLNWQLEGYGYVMRRRLLMRASSSCPSSHRWDCRQGPSRSFF